MSIGAPLTLPLTQECLKVSLRWFEIFWRELMISDSFLLFISLAFISRKSFRRVDISSLYICRLDCMFWLALVNQTRKTRESSLQNYHFLITANIVTMNLRSKRPSTPNLHWFNCFLITSNLITANLGSKDLVHVFATELLFLHYYEPSFHYGEPSFRRT